MKLSDTLIEAVAPASRDTVRMHTVSSAQCFNTTNLLYLFGFFICVFVYFFKEMHVIESLNRIVQLKY